MDAVVATKRFSQVGGLQLDQDVRALVAYAGDLTQRPVRDKFAELTQVGPPAPPVRCPDLPAWRLLQQMVCPFCFVSLLQRETPSLRRLPDCHAVMEKCAVRFP